jgi:hypothetical protein
MIVFWGFVRCVLFLVFLFVLHLFLTIIATWCVTLVLALRCCCLVWHVVSHLALLLLIMVHHFALWCYYCLLWLVIFHLALLLLVVVHHPLFCTIATCYGASSPPCNVHYCCYLLWSIVLHFALLLFVMVRCPSPCIVACVVRCLHIVLLLFAMVHHPSPCAIVCYGSLSSPCINVIFCCGLSPFALCCCLLWCIALVLHYCYLLWFVAFRVTLLCHCSMPFPNTHLTFPFVCYL